MIDQVIFLDSPQYGSELANFVVHNKFEFNVVDVAFDYLNDTWGTSRANFRHLCRGGDTVWDMHHNIPLNIPPENVACTVGTYGGFLEGAGYLYTRTCNIFGREYYVGLKRGDGIVPATSQNMQSLDKKIKVVYLNKNHVECQTLDTDGLNDEDNCKDLYELIKERMNKS
jgi:hypothetical protein